MVEAGQNVNPNSPFIFDMNQVTNGAAIGHIVGSQTITLAPNQVYMVSSSIDIINPVSSPPAVLGTSLQLNGVNIVPGSSSVSNPISAGTSTTVTNTVLVNTLGLATPQLTLVNNPPNATTVAVANTNPGNITIVKLQ